MTGGFSILLIVQVLTPIADSHFFLLIKYNLINALLVYSSVASAQPSLVSGILEKLDGNCVLGVSHLYV